VIGIKFYVDSPEMLSYYGLKFQVNRTSGRHHNTGQQRLYEFCYLLPFDFWTSYLVRIFFLQGCCSWFWEFPSSTSESDLSKSNWLRSIILLIPLVLVSWGRFPLCHTPIRPISTFRDQISILIVGCVTT
jgi:hypothetical protein